MLSEEGLATVTDIKDTNEDIADKTGYSTTTTTTVLTKTWLLGFPSVKDNVQINEYEENKNIRQKFADLTESTDALLRELETVKVAKSDQQESRTEHTVFADNTSIPYKYSREVLVSPSKHQDTFLTDNAYPRVTYTRKNINSNPFVDSADSMIRDNCQPETPVEGYPGFLSPQIRRKTYPGQSSTLPAGGQGRSRSRTRKVTEEYCYACDEATQTQDKAKKRCVLM